MKKQRSVHCCQYFDDGDHDNFISIIKFSFVGVEYLVREESVWYKEGSKERVYEQALDYKRQKSEWTGAF